jgi:DNA-binding transcriptional ArsR family regulator
MKTVRFQSEKMQAGFTPIPNTVLLSGLSPTAVAAYAQLARFAWQDEECWPGQAGLAEAVQVSEPTLRKAIDELKKANLVDTSRRGLGLTNTYILLESSSDHRKNLSDRTETVSVQELEESSVHSPLLKTQLTEGVVEKESSFFPLEPSSSPNAESDLGLNPARIVFDHWREVMQSPRSKFTGDKKTKIQARLSEGFTVDDLKRAIDGCAASDFHMGRDPQNDIGHGGRLHNGLGLICRNGEKVEEFMALAPDAQSGKTADEILLERSTYAHEFERADMREAGEYPFDAASDQILKAAGIEA